MLRAKQITKENQKLEKKKYPGYLDPPYNKTFVIYIFK